MGTLTGEETGNYDHLTLKGTENEYKRTNTRLAYEGDGKS
jgi:hypothetical protein